MRQLRVICVPCCLPAAGHWPCLLLLSSYTATLSIHFAVSLVQLAAVSTQLVAVQCSVVCTYFHWCALQMWLCTACATGTAEQHWLVPGKVSKDFPAHNHTQPSGNNNNNNKKLQKAKKCPHQLQNRIGLSPSATQPPTFSMARKGLLKGL